MHFIGAEERATQARAAVNRLRWEVDVELGAGHQVPAREAPGSISGRRPDAIAEGLALYRQILDTLDEHLHATDPARAQLARMLEHYRRYHEVGR